MEYQSKPNKLGISGILKSIKRKHIVGGFVCILFVIVLGIINRETYVWQSTTLNELILPSGRETCRLGTSATTSSAAMKGKSSLRIGMLMLYSGGESTWDPELMKRIVRNRNVYCKLHNCTVILSNNMIDRSRPPAWSKLTIARHYLPQFDYLFYLDMDMVIMNMSTSVVEYIEYSNRLMREDSKRQIDVLMGQDWSGPNTGAWIMRNSSWSMQFLQSAWDLGVSMVQPKTSDGISYPFQYEQRVFHYMLGTDVWKKRKLPSYQHEDDVRNHFVILPQCTMNSYSIHPLEYRANRFDSQYVSGDLLIHFPGKAPDNKVGLMNHYLDIVEKTYSDYLKRE